PAARCSGLRLAMTTSAPSRANSDAIALPRPVPAPVTNTAVPSKVPGRSAVSPTAGGRGRPIGSVIRGPPGGRPGSGSAAAVARLAALGAGGAHLGHVVAAVDERLEDQLVLHRRPHRRSGEVADHP